MNDNFRRFTTFLKKSCRLSQWMATITTIDKRPSFLSWRHFPRYYDFTQRLLKRLRVKWVNDATPATPLLVEEIDLTLEHIKKSR